MNAAPVEPRHSRTPRNKKTSQTCEMVIERVEARTREMRGGAPSSAVGVVLAGESSGSRLDRSRPLSGITARHLVEAAVSVLCGLLVLAAALTLGPAHFASSVLDGLGFDPDRTDLITGLIVGGAAAIGAYLAGGRRSVAILMGMLVLAALFAATFVRETQDATAAIGAVGAFSPVGWAQTVLALIVVGFLTMWACATCAIPIRRRLGASGAVVLAAVRSRPRERRAWLRPVGVALVLGLLVVTVPAAGVMFDTGVDSHMVQGGPARQGLVPEAMGNPDGVLPADASPASGDAAPPSAPTAPSPSR